MNLGEKKEFKEDVVEKQKKIAKFVLMLLIVLLAACSPDNSGSASVDEIGSSVDLDGTLIIDEDQMATEKSGDVFDESVSTQDEDQITAQDEDSNKDENSVDSDQTVTLDQDSNYGDRDSGIMPDSDSEKSCSSENLALCTDSEECTNAGGYWYLDTCNEESTSSDYPSPLRIINVNNDEELITALDQAEPGDHIVLANGDYSGEFELTVDGTEANPIVIRAKNLLHARFISLPSWGTGTSHGNNLPARDILTGNHTMLWGIDIAPTEQGVVAVRGDYSKVMRCRFTNSSLWFGSTGAAAGYNEFYDITGIALIVKPAVLHARNIHIYRNYFHDFIGEGNGHEAITLGQGVVDSDIETGNIVEYNVIENVNIEEELIAVKSSNNILRFNTILDSPRGYIDNRHGSGNQYLGNWFDNCGGLEGFDMNNKYIGNRGLNSRLRVFSGDLYPADEMLEPGHPAAWQNLYAGNDFFTTIVGYDYNNDYPIKARDNRFEAHTGPITYHDGYHEGTVVEEQLTSISKEELSAIIEIRNTKLPFSIPEGLASDQVGPHAGLIL